MPFAHSLAKLAPVLNSVSKRDTRVSHHGAKRGDVSRFVGVLAAPGRMVWVGGGGARLRVPDISARWSAFGIGHHAPQHAHACGLLRLPRSHLDCAARCDAERGLD